MEESISISKQERILHIFPESMRTRFKVCAGYYDSLQEIRLRAGKPVILNMGKEELFIEEGGTLTRNIKTAYCISEWEMTDILNHVCNYSLYAFEDEIRQGFITIPGGHRIGLAGQVVLDEVDKIRYVKNIHYMNIRIAHQVKGAADAVMPILFKDGIFLNTLIISPPGCGKTTMLRDIIRQVSNGSAFHEGKTVGVIDERSEIAGSYLGLPQNDMGIRTDVMDSCPKLSGMMLLIRSMAPQVLAVDELGSREEIRMLHRIIGCGSSVVATVHGEGLSDIVQKGFMQDAIKEGMFKRYLVLGKEAGNCVLFGAYDERMKTCLK